MKTLRVSIPKTTMDKLTMHLRIILIGLSGLLSSCGIFSIDPQELEYQREL